MNRMVGRYECQEYAVPAAGGTVRLLGPRYPHALRNEPEMQKRFEEDGFVPHWASPWPAAVMLANDVIGGIGPTPQTVLELGAGLGLPGIAIARAGHCVVVTDYDEDALVFIRENASLNGVELAGVHWLDWRDPPEESYDVIVGSEVLYEKRNHAPIIDLIRACLRPGGRAFFSDTNRRATDAVFDVFRAARLDCRVVPASAPAIPNFDSIDGRIFRGRILRVTRFAS